MEYWPPEKKPKPFPDYFSVRARTFSDLFVAYLQQWPQVIADAGLGEQQVAYADRLLRLAKKIARVKRFKHIDLWETDQVDGYNHVEYALRYSMAKYKPGLWSFHRLFARNLRERLCREHAREPRRKRRQKRQERRAKANRAAQRRHETGNLCQDWSRRLLSLVKDRLDERTRTCLEMRLGGASFKEISEATGVPEKTLFNQYGGQKLTSKVRAEIRAMVMELQTEHLMLLVRHLEEEVGMVSEMVGELLGVSIEADKSVPVLEEEALLERISWKAKLFSELSANPKG